MRSHLVGIHAGCVNVCALLYSWGVDLSGDRCNENSEKSIAAAQGCESRLRSPKRSFISNAPEVAVIVLNKVAKCVSDSREALGGLILASPLHQC